MRGLVAQTGARPEAVNIILWRFQTLPGTSRRVPPTIKLLPREDAEKAVL